MLVPFGAAGAQAPAKAPAKVEGAKAAKPRKVGGPVLAVIPPDAAPLRTVLVSADGSRLVRFTEDDRVVFGLVADYLSRDKKQRTKNETRYRYALKAPLLSPRGDLLVARAADAVLAVVDPSPRQIHQLRGLPGVGACGFHPDGAQLATSMRDGLVRILDAKAGKPLRYTPIQGTAHHWVGFAAKGTVLMTAGVDKKLRFYTYPDIKMLREAPLAGPVHRVAIHHAGTQAVWAIGKQVFVHDVRGEQAERKIDLDAEVTQVAYSRDSTQLGVALVDGSVRVLDVATGAELHRFAAHPDKTLVCLAHAAAGDHVVWITAAAGGDIVFWKDPKAKGKSSAKSKKKKKPNKRR